MNNPAAARRPAARATPLAPPRLFAALGLAGLAALAGKGLIEGGYYAFQYSQDFQWSPAVLLSEGRDAFAWYLDGNADGRILMSQEPNYLHLIYVLLLPFAALPWPLAKMAWVLCSAGMGVVSGFWLAREAGLRGWTVLAALATFIAASPFAHALGAGQQSLLVLFALTWAWRKRAGALGGAAFAVAACKYSFAPPVLLWLLLERRWRALAAAALTGTAGLAAYAWLCGANPITILTEPLQVSAKATHVGLADVMSFARSLRLDAAPVYLAGLAVAGLGVALLWRRRRALDDLTIFALLCQLSLLALFHHLYDYVLLAPLFFRALAFPPVLRAVTLAYVGWFWFVVRFIDASDAMKTPAAIGAMALASAAVFVAVAMADQRSRTLSSPATSAAAL
jgi:hypothetical protein